MTMYGKIHFPVRAAVFVSILLTVAFSASAQTTLFNIEVIDEWVEIFEQDGKPLPEPKRAVLQAA